MYSIFERGFSRMLKKWMLAIGLVSVLTLAACGGGEEGDTEEQEQQEQESGEMEGDSGSEEGTETETEE